MSLYVNVNISLYWCGGGRTCVSLIKQHWKTMTEIKQECDILIFSETHFIFSFLESDGRNST